MSTDSHTAAAPTGRARAAWLVGALAVLAALSGLALLGGDDDAAAPEDSAAATPSWERAGSSPSPSASGTATPEEDGLALGSVVATFDGDALAVAAEPAGDALTTLTAWSAYGSALTLLAIDEADVGGDTWYEVLVPMQPNGTTGWIREEDVTVSSTDVRIDVYLDEHELVLSQGGEDLLTTGVVIGDPDDSPTPVGVYSVTDPLDFTANTTGVYGAYALGLSGFSETLDSFDGGLPQLAIHGTNRPELIGESVSNGCVRVTNDAVLEIAEVAGLGTPVVVHASRADG